MVHCRMTIAVSKWLIAGVLSAISVIAYAESVTLERDSPLRAEPRTDAAVVANLPKGSTGDAMARQGAWVQIKSAAATGWLYSFNVRFGAVAAEGGDSGGGSVLGRMFGPRQRVNVTATIGIRGLGEEDLKQAHFDGAQIQELDGFAANPGQAEAHAGTAGLSAVKVEYLESAPVQVDGTGANP